MYKALINGKSFEITSTPEGHSVNGVPVKLDVVKVEEDYLHVLMGMRSYRAEVVKADLESKTFTIKLNGNTYTVEVKNKFDLLLEKLGMKAGDLSKVNVIKAPMPGLIIDLKVKEGDVVKKGDALLILEAMKMENVIKAPGDGVVRHVRVRKGNSVEKNAVLLEF